MKCHVIVLDKNNVFPYFKARYDHNTEIVEVKVKRGKTERFNVNPSHIYNERRKFGHKGKKPLIIVDNATRHSVSAESVNENKKDEETKGNSLKLHSDEPLDAKERNKLNYLIEPAFWKALFGKYKMKITTFLIVWACGIGSWQIIKAILLALGLIEKGAL